MYMYVCMYICMNVLILVSSEKSSCALSVCVGAASDPLPGLAHITGKIIMGVMYVCMYECMCTYMYVCEIIE